MLVGYGALKHPCWWDPVLPRTKRNLAGWDVAVQTVVGRFPCCPIPGMLPHAVREDLQWFPVALRGLAGILFCWGQVT